MHCVPPDKMFTHWSSRIPTCGLQGVIVKVAGPAAGLAATGPGLQVGVEMLPHVQDDFGF